MTLAGLKFFLCFSQALWKTVYSSLTIMIILTAMQYGKHILVVATPWEILTRENSSPYCQTQLVTAVYADIYSALCTTTLAWISSVIMFSKGRMKSQWFTKVDTKSKKREVLLNGRKWKSEWAVMRWIIMHSGPSKQGAIKPKLRSLKTHRKRDHCVLPPWRTELTLLRVAPSSVRDDVDFEFFRRAQGATLVWSNR